MADPNLSISANLTAFLAMTRHSEGTDKVPDPYRATFRGELSPGVKKPMHIIVDLSDHPSCTGEWMGESIAFLGPQYDGEISTAAGAYQINRPVWVNLKRMLHLPGFTGPSQDAAAVELIREKGALDLVNSGRAQDAIALCRGIWASLPGSVAGQPTNSLASLLTAYSNAGGGFA